MIVALAFSWGDPGRIDWWGYVTDRSLLGSRKEVVPCWSYSTGMQMGLVFHSNPRPNHYPGPEKASRGLRGARVKRHAMNFQLWLVFEILHDRRALGFGERMRWGWFGLVNENQQVLQYWNCAS